MKTNSLATAYLMAAAAPIIWGSTYVVTTEWLPEDVPLLSSVIRALPSGILLTLASRKLPEGHWWWRAMVLGLLNIGLFFYCLFVAAYYLPGGVAALIMSSQTLWVLGLGAVILAAPIRGMQLGACVLGILGVASLALNKQADLNWIGVVAGLGGAASMALGVVLTKHWGRPAGVGNMAFTGWQLTFGGLLLAPIALMSESLPASLSTENIMGFAYLSIIGALFSYLMWFRGLERLPAISISFIAFLSPVSATVLGYLVLDQTLSPLQIFGAGLIIIAILISQPELMMRLFTRSPSTAVLHARS